VAVVALNFSSACADLKVGATQTVAYGNLSNENPAPITPAYERQADTVIEVQLEKAGVSLAYLLDANSILNALKAPAKSFQTRRARRSALRLLNGDSTLKNLHRMVSYAARSEPTRAICRPGWDFVRVRQ